MRNKQTFLVIQRTDTGQYFAPLKAGKVRFVKGIDYAICWETSLRAQVEHLARKCNPIVPVIVKEIRL